MAFVIDNFAIAVDGCVFPISVSRLATFGEIELDTAVSYYEPNMSEVALKLLAEQIGLKE